MPCNAIRETTQILENIPDIGLLASGLTEMGFTAQVSGNMVIFSGVDKTSGMYQNGSYQNGKLTTQEGLDLDLLAKYVAKANVKKQIAQNNSDKYKAKKITAHWTGEFEFTITSK
jgi:hypothetical protein